MFVQVPKDPMSAEGLVRPNVVHGKAHEVEDAPGQTVPPVGEGFRVSEGPMDRLDTPELSLDVSGRPEVPRRRPDPNVNPIPRVETRRDVQPSRQRRSSSARVRTPFSMRTISRDLTHRSKYPRFS